MNQYVILVRKNFLEKKRNNNRLHFYYSAVIFR